jgi:hypothetical protein
MPLKEPPFERFLKSRNICEKTGCWHWTGGMQKNGYGWLKVFGKNELAHRFSYSLYNGPLLLGQEIMHSCDVRHCVNPAHLKQGSHAENMADAVLRGRVRKGAAHPMYGKSNPRPKQSNKVIVLGRIYDSQKQAERHLGLGSGTVRYWLKTNSSKAQLLEKGEQNGRFS